MRNTNWNLPLKKTQRRRRLHAGIRINFQLRPWSLRPSARQTDVTEAIPVKGRNDSAELPNYFTSAAHRRVSEITGGETVCVSTSSNVKVTQITYTVGGMNANSLQMRWNSSDSDTTSERGSTTSVSSNRVLMSVREQTLQRWQRAGVHHLPASDFISPTHLSTRCAWHNVPLTTRRHHRLNPVETVFSYSQDQNQKDSFSLNELLITPRMSPTLVGFIIAWKKKRTSRKYSIQIHDCRLTLQLHTENYKLRNSWSAARWT